MDWTGMDWTGMDWTGMDWTGMDWTGMDWTGMDWTGMDWTGMDWTGMDWTGMDWTGMDWTKVSGTTATTYYTASIESGCLLIQVLWQDSSTTMEHACSRIQSYISKQLLRILDAPGMLHTH